MSSAPCCARITSRAGATSISVVEFGSRDPYSLADAYFDMLDELRDLLGEPVDLVMVGAIKNPYILADIEQSKQLLYAA